ncbi:MAG: segregation/condensation protein A [Lachnospiraceae bacterium]|nr:segregation/condensation protein A [Lachnospiraceae bacterium]
MGINVKLSAFEGPLDLLLHLIEKNKVNIYDIPIAVVTEQYLEYIEEMQKADMDIMSEFLVMAATLLKIKSQMLLPKEINEEGEGEDPRAELVQRLIEYKVYKYASDELKDLEIEANKCLYKMPTLPGEVLEYREPIDPEAIIRDQGVTLLQLKEVFEFVMRRRTDKLDPIRSQFGEIKQDEVKIEDKITYIKKKVENHKKMSFSKLLERQATKEEIIVTFLALLELMKIGEIHVFQEDIGSEILLCCMGNKKE